jgi:Tau95 Triple barrel domain
MKEVCVVEFLGVLADRTDVSGAIAALGGPEAVRQATCLANAGAQASPLNLTLRPGELGSRSNIGSSAMAMCSDQFLLHVTSPSETSACGPPSSQASNLQLRCEIVARIATRVAFPGFADFQYFSRDVIEAVSTVPMQHAPACMSPWKWTHSSGLPPAIITLPADTSTANNSGACVTWREKTPHERASELSMYASRLIRDGAGEHGTELAQELRPIRFARSPIEVGVPDAWLKIFSKISADVTPTSNDVEAVATGTAQGPGD